MKAVIDIDKLKTSPEFNLIRVLRHDEVIEFVLTQIRQLRWPMILFYLLVASLLTKTIAFSLNNIAYTVIPWQDYWKFLGIGLVCGMIMVIPFHELLHGLAYGLAGAKRVKYGADLKQMLFYASAPGFVAGRATFYFVAFCPFLVINALFLTGIIMGTPDCKWGSLVALTVHSSMCIGDFAMANFFSAFPEREVYTYDEEKTRISYFYIKKTAGSSREKETLSEMRSEETY